MKPTEPEQKSLKEKLTDSSNFFYMFTRVHETCLAPFIRTNYGREELGMAGLLAALMILLYAGLTNSAAMVVFLIVWIFVMSMQRVRTQLAERRGVIVHSRYSGWPWLAFKLPLVRSEGFAKGVVEPLMYFLFGMSFLPFSRPLGVFIMAGFMTVMAKTGMEQALMRVRVQRLRDAQIEQRQMNEELHG